MKGFFTRLPQNILEVFKPVHLGWHFLAVILTFVTVSTGFDWLYFTNVQDPTIQAWLFPAVIIGFFLPIILPLVLLAFGQARKNKKMIVTAWTLGQAALIGFLVSSFYKILTGRIQPDLTNTINDISHQFQFGFWQHGIFWGWPSSHTTVAVAMMVSLMVLYPKNKILKFFAILYGLYIGFGVSVGVHWFSEFLAGTIFGILIGLVVGRFFKAKI